MLGTQKHHWAFVLAVARRGQAGWNWNRRMEWSAERPGHAESRFEKSFERFSWYRMIWIITLPFPCRCTWCLDTRRVWDWCHWRCTVRLGNLQTTLRESATSSFDSTRRASESKRTRALYEASVAASRRDTTSSSLSNPLRRRFQRRLRHIHDDFVRKICEILRWKRWRRKLSEFELHFWTSQRWWRTSQLCQKSTETFQRSYQASLRTIQLGWSTHG